MATTWDNDPLIKQWREEDMAEIAELEENDLPRGSFGHWSANGCFRIDREWVDYGEDEGIGRGPDDTFQEEMAEVIVKNRRALVIGRGGTGKSHLIGLLRPKFKALGYKVMCIAFTHVAVANVNDVEYPAYTILHLLHRFVGSKRNKKKHAIIVDECSMVPMSMWSALLNVTFTGHTLVVLGDPHGQFAPIEDQHRMEQWEGLWDSRFMCDLCGCLRITLRKFRRQAADNRPLDFGHFRFVGSLYPERGVPLVEAIAAARSRYPAAGRLFFGTTLCITHKCRVFVNSMVNSALARSDAIFVPAVHAGWKDANQPQDMKVWAGIVLIARCGSKEQNLKNGVRYRLLAITAESDSDDEEPASPNFEMTAVDDEDKPLGTSFMLTMQELGSKMRLSHAITYFSSQARTIHGGLRLAQTSSKLFTLRHLIVGLGRGPIGADIQVE